MKNDESFYHGETFTFEHNGDGYTALFEFDDSCGTPWDEHDGHGPVSKLTLRAKKAGELLLSENGQYRRFYDYAEACKIAFRDQWGWMPEKVVDTENPDGSWTLTCGTFTANAETYSEAYRKIYDAHRATMTPKQYAAEAVKRDYEYLKSWCNEEWFFGTLTVRKTEDCPRCGKSETVGMLASNDGADIFAIVALDLAKTLAEESK